MRLSKLCVDIGGTRIKAVVLPDTLTWEDLKNARPFVVRTLGWLNHSMVNLFQPDNWRGLANHFKKQGLRYDSIHVCLPGPVSKGRYFDREDLLREPAKVPMDLGAAIQGAAGVPVYLAKDADAWIMGFIRYMELVEKAVDYPVLLYAFGTGCGVSAATGPRAIRSIEAGKSVRDWDHLRRESNHPMTEAWHVHAVLGKRYFEWVEKDERSGWDYVKIRHEYSRRVIAATMDIKPYVENQIGKIRTIVLAGGNAEFVSVRTLENEFDVTVVDLTDRHAKVNPDVIALLGIASLDHACSVDPIVPKSPIR